MASCCSCSGGSKSNLPLICLVPRDGARPDYGSASKPQHASTSGASQSHFKLLDDDYLRKHFKLPKRALYLDPFRRPLITFPMTQEISNNFNLARKNQINKQILDGYLDPSAAISAPNIFPYAKSDQKKRKKAEDDEEIIYILQLPDLEFKCPVHNETIKTPRFIWHSCKKRKEEKRSEYRRGGAPMKKPKPWLLSRHTDFDLLSQW